MGTPRLWYKRILVIVIALIFLGIFTIKVSSEPKFCGSCHEMSTEVKNWETSTHDKMPCSSCHKLTIMDKGNMLFKHVTFQQEVSSGNPVECVSCHQESRIITPSGDLRIPHQFHLEQNIPCGNCHPGAGHISSSVVASTSRIAEYPTQVMAVCLRCHYKKGGNISCRACHLRPPVTIEHLQAGWKNSHGAEALDNIAECNRCHSYTLFLDDTRRTTTDIKQASIARYTRDNAFCADCHRNTKPYYHTDWFLFEHPRWVGNTDEGCLVCHQFYQPLPIENLPELYCQECHAYRGWVPYIYGDRRLLRQPIKEPGP